MEFSATIYFLKTEEGGRKSRLASGYRPAFYFGDRQIDGVILFDSSSYIFPGETRRVKVRLLHATHLAQKLIPGTAFEIKEGLKIVGRGYINQRIRDMQATIDRE